ncbi:MAG: hypothetical protein M3R52_00210 [Acidobacteriota bacterium]|nr:hypothetical protein [Acidobacteriota bacterium]
MRSVVKARLKSAPAAPFFFNKPIIRHGRGTLQLIADFVNGALISSRTETRERVALGDR